MASFLCYIACIKAVIGMLGLLGTSGALLGGLLVASEPLLGLLEPIWAYPGDKAHPYVLHQEMLALLGPFGPYLGLCGW